MSTFTPETKNISSFTPETQSRSGATLSTAGLYYGFGCFTYSGGQILSSGSLPVFTSETKNLSTFTSQTKS